jgi:hypothetical protein
MAMTEIRASEIRRDISQRLSAIATSGSRLSRRQLAEGVDAIRSIAHIGGFNTVETLAGRLESALARESCRSTVHCYLDALGDAVKLEPIRSSAQQALLASVALRVGH